MIGQFSGPYFIVPPAKFKCLLIEIFPWIWTQSLNSLTDIIFSIRTVSYGSLFFSGRGKARSLTYRDCEFSLKGMWWKLGITSCISGNSRLVYLNFLGGDQRETENFFTLRLHVWIHPIEGEKKKQKYANWCRFQRHIEGWINSPLRKHIKLQGLLNCALTFSRPLRSAGYKD